MLKNRMFVLAGILIVLLALAVSIVAARSEVAAGPSGNSAVWEKYRTQNVLQNESSMQKPGTPLDDCFDVSLSELENCRSAD